MKSQSRQSRRTVPTQCSANAFAFGARQGVRMISTFSLRRFYVLFFIAHASRRVWVAGCTRNPTAEWVTQQARNLALDVSDTGARLPQRRHPDREDAGAGTKGERDRREVRP